MAADPSPREPTVLPNTVVTYVQPQMTGFMSFMGRPTCDRAELQLYIRSPHVDLQRQYSYPEWYRLTAMNLASAFLVTAVVGYVCSCLLVGPLIEYYAWAFGFAFVCLNWCVCLGNTATAPQPLSMKEFRHSVGSSSLSVSSIAYFTAGLVLSLAMDCLDERVHPLHHTMLYIWKTVSAFTFLTILWLIMNEFTIVPVTWSFLMSMFWSGATFVIFGAGLWRRLFIYCVFPMLSPDCNLGQATGETPGMLNASPQCMRALWFQYMFSSGMIQEGLKLAVLMRLRTRIQDITGSCWLTRCPRSSETPIPCCSWMLKLAVSPTAIFLAGVAAGGGYGTMENCWFVEVIMRTKNHRADPWAPSIRVLPASLQMIWTGIVASCFAIEKFFAPRCFGLKYVALLMSIMLHASWNAFTLFAGLGKVDGPSYVEGYEIWGSSQYTLVGVLAVVMFMLGLILVLALERRLYAMQAAGDIELCSTA